MRIFPRRNQFVLALGAPLLTLAMSACQSATMSTGPSPTKCQIVLGPPGPFGAAGGPGTVTVAAAPECPWTASTTAPWISSLAPAAGQGGAEIQFQVSPNPTGTPRQADIMFSGFAARISQAATACTITLNPTSQTISAAGGTGTVAVTTPAGCDWTAASPDAWLTVTSGTTGSGGGTVTFAVAANGGTTRVGTIAIGGQSFNLTQQGPSTSPQNPPGGAPAPNNPSPSCTYGIEPPTYAAVADVDTVLVVVSAGVQCAWTAVSQSSWLAIVGTATGTGNGSVAVRAAANTGAARTGTVTIADQTFTVMQAAAPSQSPGPSPSPSPTPTPAPTPPPPSPAPTPTPTPCTFTINPTTASVGAGGGSGPTVSVSTDVGCAWTAVASASSSWISVTSGASGSGNGTVAYSVALNAGAARTGTIAMAGQTHTVTQAAACIVSINPTSFAAPAAGGPGPAIAVTVDPGCTWTASPIASSWITINTGASGTGDGTVTFTVAANTGPLRIGTIGISGQIFTVTQATGCTYAISPTSATIHKNGNNTNPVTVTAPAGCPWTAVSNVSWMTVLTGASGTGPGTVTYSVTQNSGSDRDGTLTIAGLTFSVHQND